MRKLGKIVLWVVVALTVILTIGIAFTIGWRPFLGPRARALTPRKFESTPARLARGEYLVMDVTDCIACHAQHDWIAHDAAILPATLGAGQDMNQGFSRTGLCAEGLSWWVLAWIMPAPLLIGFVDVFNERRNFHISEISTSEIAVGRIDWFHIPGYKRVVTVIQAIWPWAARQAKT